MSKLLPIWLFFILCFAIACCGKKAVQENQTRVKFSKAPAIVKIVKNPDLYVDSLVTISGELINQGKDYFKDLRLAIKDPAGNSIRVLPWLPIEIPPMKDSTMPRPKILSDYLNKKITLTGYLRCNKSRPYVDCEHYLEVKEAIAE